MQSTSPFILFLNVNTMWIRFRSPRRKTVYLVEFTIKVRKKRLLRSESTGAGKRLAGSSQGADA